MSCGYNNIQDYEPFSSGGADWTPAFQHAVKALEERGGGTLYVPAGRYATRSIHLKSYITLYLDSGAHLDFMDDYENFPLVDTEFEGLPAKMYMPLIYADHAQQIAIQGCGLIDGNGRRAWNEKDSLPFKRPYLICFQYCQGVKIRDITLVNSPVWTIHPLYCEDVMIQGVTIKNPPASPNTDGINPDSCSNVHISDCTIDVGDDCIAIKAGTEITPVRIACENITITNCCMLHGHGGVVIGSEMSGSIRRVTVSNCVFQGTDRGIRIKTRRKRGGVVEMLTFENIIMDGVLCPFSFHMYYCCGMNGQDGYVRDKQPYVIDEGTPSIRNLLLSNILVSNASVAAGFLYGLAEQNIENVTFRDISICMNQEGEPGMPDMLEDMEPMRAAGFFIRNAKNICFHHVDIHRTIGVAINQDASVDLKII